MEETQRQKLSKYFEAPTGEAKEKKEKRKKKKKVRFQAAISLSFYLEATKKQSFLNQKSPSKTTINSWSDVAIFIKKN
jgi:hypothetical protein